jgi:kumamolisin
VLAAANAAGIAVFSASGDYQSFCNGTGFIANDADVPADLLNQTGVGGTTLTVNNNGSYATESWWGAGVLTPPSCQGNVCTGGGFGVSKYFSRPSFQNGFTGATGRSVPDVSADADPSTGIVLCVDGTCNQNALHGGRAWRLRSGPRVWLSSIRSWATGSAT